MDRRWHFFRPVKYTNIKTRNNGTENIQLSRVKNAWKEYAVTNAPPFIYIMEERRALLVRQGTVSCYLHSEKLYLDLVLPVWRESLFYLFRKDPLVLPTDSPRAEPTYFTRSRLCGLVSLARPDATSRSTGATSRSTSATENNFVWLVRQRARALNLSDNEHPRSTRLTVSRRSPLVPFP